MSTPSASSTPAVPSPAGAVPAPAPTERLAVTSRLAQTYRVSQPMVTSGRVVAAPRSSGQTDLVSIGSGGTVFHLHPAGDGDGTWVADNLGCPQPATDVAAIGNPDGTLTFYAVVASSPKPGIMMKPEAGAWTAVPAIPDSVLPNTAAAAMALQTGYDVKNQPHVFAQLKMSNGRVAVARLDAGPWVVSPLYPITGWAPGQGHWFGNMGMFLCNADQAGPHLQLVDGAGSFGMDNGVTDLSAMSACRTRRGLSNLFAVRKSDQGVYWFPFDGDGWTGPPTKLTGDTKVSALQAASAAGAMNVFALDTDGFIHHTGEHADNPGNWSTPLKLNRDIAFASFVGASPFTESAEALARTKTGVVYRIWQEPGGEGWHLDPIEAASTSALEEVSAYNVQITVYDPADVILANSAISVRCDEPVTLEVNGQSAFFGEGNPWTGTTNAAGQVIVSVPTQSLGVPKLTVTVGGADVEIDPSAPVRDYLATVDATKLRAAMVTADDGTRTPLLSPANQSPATVDALVKGITAAAQSVPLDATPSAPPGFFHRLNDHRVTSFMTAARPGPTNDSAPASSWMFEFKPGAPTFRVLTTDERAAIASQHAALPAAELFFGLDFSWGDVFDAITSGVASIVSAVADTIGKAVNAAVTLIIDGVTYVYNAVVAAAEQALDLIEEMFKTVVDGFEQVYRWLGFIFDWGDIQRSKNAIKYLMNQGIDYSVSVVQQLRTVVDRAFPAFQSDLHQRFVSFANQIGGGTSIDGYRAAHPVSEDVERKVDDASSSNIVQQSMLNHLGQVNLGAPKLSASATALAAAEGVGDAITQMIAQFKTIGAQSQSADAFTRAGAWFASIKDHPEQILQRAFAGLIEVCDGLTQLALDLVHTFVDLVFDAIALAMTEVKNLLNAAWSIPVVSQLYAKYFGGELSTLDLIALSIAVPGTALYKILFSAAPFPDDASEKAFEALLTTAEMQRLSGWPARSAAEVARSAPRADAASAVLTSNPDPWIVVDKTLGTFQAVCRGLFIIPDTLLDVLPSTAAANRISVLNNWALGLGIAGFLTGIPWRDGRAIAPGCETDDAVERLGWLLQLIPIGIDCGFFYNEVRQNRPGAIARNLDVPGAVATAAGGLLGLAMTITWAVKNEGKDAIGIAGGIIDGIPGVVKWVPQLLPLGPPRVIGKAALGVLDVACGVTAVGLAIAGLVVDQPA